MKLRRSYEQDTRRVAFAFALGVLALVLILVSSCSRNDDASEAVAREASDPRILIAGSSTIAPFVTTAAEYFHATSGFAFPIVETTGTGGGLKLFCRGVAPDHSSIATASRRITKAERANCNANGVSDIIELKLGHDGIVLIHARAAPDIVLSRTDLYRALAEELLIEGEFRANPNIFWSDIRPDLPQTRIELFGPPPTSGTRDAFIDLVMEPGAMADPDMKALAGEDPRLFTLKTHTLRTDGAWTDSGENDSHIVQLLHADKTAFGVVGYVHLAQNGDRVKPIAIDGVQPRFENIVRGDYPLSRPLFLYVKGEHIGVHPALGPFIAELFSEAAMGQDGYLTNKGLIPLNEADRLANLERFQDAETARTNSEVGTRYSFDDRAR